MADVFEGLYPKVVVSPLALAAILDAHTRRGERECLCALVGTLSDDGSLAVTDVVVNFEEKGMPQKQHHESFVLARQRVNPRELLLGWASTRGGSMTWQKLHEIAAWARTDTKSSRFIPQRRFPAPVAMLVTAPTGTSDLEVHCQVRGPGNAVKEIPLQYTPCFLSEFQPQLADQVAELVAETAREDRTAAGVAQTILERIEEALEIARQAKAEHNVAVGRRLLNLVALSGIDVEEFIAVNKEEAALFDWIKNIAQLQLQLTQKRQLSV